MRLAVTVSEIHQGKMLELDCDQEIITVLDEQGHLMGSVSWDSFIDWVRSTSQADATHARVHPRAPLAVKVHYSTTEGKFIESSMPLPVGSSVNIQFALPDRPLDTIRASGTVCWVRAKPDRFTLYPGMGIQFTDIDAQARDHVMDLVKSLIQVRQARTVPQ